MNARALMRASVLLVAAVSACGDQRSSIPTRLGDLRLELPITQELSRQVSWDFGEVPVGTSTGITLGLVNVGEDRTELAARFEDTTSAAFFVLAPDALGAGSRDQVVLTFAPPSPGPYSARLVLENDGQGGEPIVQLSGSAR